MTFPIVTLGTAGVLALLFVWLSVAVVRQRFATRTSLGEGSPTVATGEESNASPLFVAVRTQANFAENVPLSLLLLLLLELVGAPQWALLVLAALLVVSRVLHAIGLGRPSPNPLRGAIVLNWLMLLLGGVYALALAFALS